MINHGNHGRCGKQTFCSVSSTCFQSTMDEGKQGLEEPVYTQNCVLDETLKRNENCQWAVWPLTITTLSNNKAKQKPVKGKSNDET